MEEETSLAIGRPLDRLAVIPQMWRDEDASQGGEAQMDKKEGCTGEQETKEIAVTAMGSKRGRPR